MGLLDDAIREHLDLKRRRGADPAEVERAEREALGPVRRNRDPADVASRDETESTAPDDAPFPDEQEWSHSSQVGEGDLGAEFLDEEEIDDEGLDDEHHGDDELASKRARGGRPAEEPAPRRRRWGRHRSEPRDEDEPFPTAPPASRDLSATAAGDTAEHHLDEEPAADDEAGGEDVLEETPDFLQDTPDHDRLWFEQRPPRDFDFDG